MIYAFRCHNCGMRRDSQTREPFTCMCGEMMSRDYRSVSINPHPNFQPHFNWSVGSYVNTKREFEDEMKRKNDEVSERLGIDHNFTPKYERESEPPHRDSDDILNTAARVTNDSSIL